MKKPTPIQISIPQPCTQDWNEMQPVPGGRHCVHCQKAVVDFSRMTDGQLLAHFQKANSAACGRFTAEQLDRAIKAVEVPRSTWWARVAAGLLLALGLSKNAAAQSRNHKEVSEQQSSRTQKQEEAAAHNSTEALEIYGTLVDENGNPVVNAYVSITEGGVEVQRDTTDFDGNYSMEALKRGRFDVHFSYRSHELTITDIVPQHSKTKVCGMLTLVNNHCKSIIVGMIRAYTPPLIDPEYPGGHKIHSSNMLPNGW